MLQGKALPYAKVTSTAAVRLLRRQLVLWDQAFGWPTTPLKPNDVYSIGAVASHPVAYVIGVLVPLILDAPFFYWMCDNIHP
jgi:hypothetical protein